MPELNQAEDFGSVQIFIEIRIFSSSNSSKFYTENLRNSFRVSLEGLGLIF